MAVIAARLGVFMISAGSATRGVQRHNQQQRGPDAKCCTTNNGDNPE